VGVFCHHCSFTDIDFLFSRIDLNPTKARPGDRPQQDWERGMQPARRLDSVPAPDPEPTSESQEIVNRPEDNTSMAQLHNASVEERIATLRRLRQEHQGHSPEETGEESQNRRRSLTARLRERFRIRTRQHGAEP
jgi:hypothetical protein